MSQQIFQTDAIEVSANGDAGDPKAAFIHLSDKAHPYMHKIAIRVERTPSGWMIEKRHDFKVNVRA